MLPNNPDKSWELLGKSNPYYGVITDKRFRNDKLDRSAKSIFFQSGESAIELLMSKLEKSFGPISKGLALDFGCGVGRLVIPLARRFDRVVGLDISPAMLKEAAVNVQEQSVEGVELLFSEKLFDLKPEFDFVHSYIVFQHIPVKRGERYFQQLVRILQPGGIGAIHFTFSRQRTLGQILARWLRYNFAPLNGLFNMLRGLPFSEPMMQMNDYSLNRLMQILHDQKIVFVSVELLLNNDEHLGGYILFKKN